LLDLAEFGVEFREGFFAVGIAALRVGEMLAEDAEAFLDTLEITPEAGEGIEDFLGAFFDLHPAKAEQDCLQVRVEAVWGNGHDAFLQRLAV